MTVGPANFEVWSRRRFWTTLVLVFALQIACIFWLGARTPLVSQTSGSPSIVFLAASGANDGLALAEPALFVLPHRYGFSGSAWLTVPARRLDSVDWTGPNGWLPFTTAPVGNSFPEFAATNPFVSFQLAAKPDPEFGTPRLPVPLPLPTNSALRIAGPLAARQLFFMPPLPVWAHTNVLTNTVVQVLADARGNVFSWTLMGVGSGLAAADEEAIRLARAARFEPLNSGGQSQSSTDFTLGTMIFQWLTVPVRQSGTPITPP
jgi:hypothetical protein